MTDLEITKLCAEAAILQRDQPIESHGQLFLCYHPIDERVPRYHLYDPLHDDAQAMALVKKFGLALWGNDGTASEWKWHAEEQIFPDHRPPIIGHGQTANRAICGCVAKMMKAKNEAEPKL